MFAKNKADKKRTVSLRRPFFLVLIRLSAARKGAAGMAGRAAGIGRKKGRQRGRSEKISSAQRKAEGREYSLSISLLSA